MHLHRITRPALIACVAVFAALLMLPAAAFAATPHKVTGLKLNAAVTSASLTWSKASHASSYKVYRASYGSSSFKLIKTTASPAYVATGLTAGARYVFKVRAYNGRYGSFSSSAVASLHPADLADLARDANGMLTWSASAGAATYQVTIDVNGYPTSYHTATGLSADFSYLLPIFGTEAIEFSVSPVSAAGVKGSGIELASTSERVTFRNLVEGVKAHETLVVPANTPVNVTFVPSTMGCSANIHFTTGTFTKTSAAMQNVRWHSDGLAAGVYPWKCSMDNCCYGTLVIE